MKEELWLKKIKERLDDYSEDLPADGWQRLEQALEEADGRLHNKRKPARIVPLRRWSAAAAAALLVAIFTLSFWLLGGPAGEEMERLAQTPEEELIPSKAARPAISPLPSSGDRGERHLAMASTEQRHVIVTTSAEVVPAYPDNRHGDKIVEEETLNTEAEEKTAGNEVRPQRQRKTSLESPAILPERTRQVRKGWSFGLSVGGHGASTDNGASLLMNSDMSTGDIGLVPASNINLSAMANGVITIPNGQTLAFKKGKPYLTTNKRKATKAEHRQPISVGFSVRRELGKGFSVETGLMYTFLSSDLRYEDTPEDVSQKLHYVGIPLRASWNFVDTRLFSLYLSAGGAVEKCVYGKQESNDLPQKPWQFSVSGAVGVQYNLSKRVGLYAEPGVSYYFDDGSSLQTIRKEHPCSFTLQAGLRLTY